MVRGAVLGVLLLGMAVVDAAASEEAVPVDAGVGAPAADVGTEPTAPGPGDSGATGSAPPSAESPRPPVDPEPPAAAPPPAAVAPAPAPERPVVDDATDPGDENASGDDRGAAWGQDRPAGQREDGAAGDDRGSAGETDRTAGDTREDAAGDERGAAGDAPSAGRAQASAAPVVTPRPAVEDPRSVAAATQPATGRVTAIDPDAAPAGDHRAALAQRAGRVLSREREHAEPPAPGAWHAPTRAAPASAPPLLGQPVAARSSVPAVGEPRTARVRSSRAHGPHDRPRHAAPRRTGGDPATPAPTMPPGGAVQAVSGAAAAGGAGPELPGILFAIVAASGTSALRRHRIALIVRMPSNCSTPLERPG